MTKLILGIFFGIMFLICGLGVAINETFSCMIYMMLFLYYMTMGTDSIKQKKTDRYIHERWKRAKKIDPILKNEVVDTLERDLN